MLRTLRNGLLSFVGLTIMAAIAHCQDPRVQPVPAPLPMPELIQVMPTVPVILRPMTVGEFVAGFQPVPGHYEVVLLHPRTHCPVKVCFTLPPGCVKKVRYRCNELEFDYGRREVEIHFRRDGRVVVDYD